MERIIKFRFWEKTSQKFITDIDALSKNVSVLISYVFEGKDKLIIPSQFTGLIDKNGIEVYEGDVIKWKETRFHTKEQEIKGVAMPKFYQSVVEWQDGEFIVSSEQNRDTPLCCFFGDSMDNKFDYKAEIIGNIYQNTELLTPTKQNN